MYGVEGERVDNLFFAGEHCSQDFQGYMEGGCETGEAAAAEILEDLGLPPSAVQQRTRPLNSRRVRFRPFARPRKRR
jgi:monoamine oxidase